MTTLSAPASARSAAPGLGAVRAWLIVVALMVALTAVIGAATRLTGSGLSITEWAPILGVIPPLNEADWQTAFAKYQAIPQYEQLNKGMSLAAFKAIFYWEWFHRLIARSIGAVFLLPFLYFLWRGAIPRRIAPRLAMLFVLGGLQGFIGWYMVSSGLVGRVDVSQYRLTLHLGMAILIFGITLWTVLELGPRAPAIHLDTLTSRQRSTARIILGLTYLQVLLGAIVAGLKAGRTYNTWPLMDGSLIPGGLFQISPVWHNVFENAALVQFNHRALAYVLAVLILVHAAGVIRRADDERARRTAGWLAALVIAQIGLGIWTLLAWVPVSLGVAHQIGAIAVFAAAIAHAFAMRPEA